MKTFLSTLAGCMVASGLIFISSCSEPEEPGIKKKPEVRPSVMDMDIVASIYPATTTAMPVRDSLRIFFNAGDLVETTIDGKPHRAVIDLITLESTIKKVWAEDKLSGNAVSGRYAERECLFHTHGKSTLGKKSSRKLEAGYV